MKTSKAMKKSLLSSFILFCFFQLSALEISYYTSGNGYDHEVAVAKEAMRCLTNNCLEGLERTGFINERTTYDKALLEYKMDFLHDSLNFNPPLYIENFREDLELPELTFYISFYSGEDDQVFLQIRLELAYEKGLLYAKDITLQEGKFTTSPKEKFAWDISSETIVEKTTNIPSFPSPPLPEKIYVTRGLNLCSGCRTKKLITRGGNRKYILNESVEYDHLEKVDHNLLRAKKDGLYGLIDHDNNTVIPIEFTKLTTVAIRNVIAHKNDKVGVYRMDGTLQIPIIYDSIVIEHAYDKNFSGLYIVRSGDKWGVLNYKNEVIIPTIFDEIELFYSRYFRVRKDNKYGVLHYDGKVIEATKYDAIEFYTSIENRFYQSKKKGQKWRLKRLENLKGQIRTYSYK